MRQFRLEMDGPISCATWSSFLRSLLAPADGDGSDNNDETDMESGRLQEVSPIGPGRHYDMKLQCRLAQLEPD